MNRLKTSDVEVLVVADSKRIFTILEARVVDGSNLEFDDFSAIRDCLMIKDQKRHERSAATYYALPCWEVPDGVAVVSGKIKCEQSHDPFNGCDDISYDFELTAARTLTPKEFLVASAGHQLWTNSTVLHH